MGKRNKNKIKKNSINYENIECNSMGTMAALK
jgi:hypothetical protein